MGLTGGAGGRGGLLIGNGGAGGAEANATTTSAAGAGGRGGDAGLLIGNGGAVAEDAGHGADGNPVQNGGRGGILVTSTEGPRRPVAEFQRR